MQNDPQKRFMIQGITTRFLKDNALFDKKFADLQKFLQENHSDVELKTAEPEKV